MSWVLESLSRVATILMGQSPPGSTYNETGDGLPFFQGVKDFGARYPTKRVYCTAPTRIAEAGDILFSVRAPIGSINRADQKCAIGRGLAAIRAQRNCDTDFLEFLLRNMKSAWGAFDSQGAIFGNARKEDQEDLKVAWPPEHVRKAIASILSTYDDLIENNRRRIRLLEQAARLLYKEWFVHLRFPGHEHVKVVDGMPEGWAKGTVADFGEITTGKTPSTKTPENFGGNIPFVKTPDMHHSRIIVETEESLSERGAATQPKKTLPVGTILVAYIGAKLGVVSITSRPCQTNQQINAVIPRKNYMRHYSLFALIDLKPRLEAMGGGATMPNVNKTKFASIPVLIPPQQLLQEFEVFVKASFQQIQLLHQQNLSLASARDLLLPRLMNGEVAV